VCPIVIDHFERDEEISVCGRAAIFDSRVRINAVDRSGGYSAVNSSDNHRSFGDRALQLAADIGSVPEQVDCTGVEDKLLLNIKRS